MVPAKQKLVDSSMLRTLQSVMIGLSMMQRINLRITSRRRSSEGNSIRLQFMQVIELGRFGWVIPAILGHPQSHAF